MDKEELADQTLEHYFKARKTLRELFELPIDLDIRSWLDLRSRPWGMRFKTQLRPQDIITVLMPDKNGKPEHTLQYRLYAYDPEAPMLYDAFGYSLIPAILVGGETPVVLVLSNCNHITLGDAT